MLIINESSQFPVLLTCEHSSNFVPNDIDIGLSKSEDIFQTHFAYDIGCKELTTRIAHRLKCPAIMSEICRLVIDCNRPLGHEQLIWSKVDGLSINQNISQEELEARISRYYSPFHGFIEKKLQTLYQPLILSIHSFTPDFEGEKRPWDIGIMYDRAEDLKNYFKSFLNDSELNIGENVPYNLKDLKTGTVIQQGDEKGIPALLLEINQNVFRDPVKISLVEDSICNFVTRWIENDVEKDTLIV